MCFVCVVCVCFVCVLCVCVCVLCVLCVFVCVFVCADTLMQSKTVYVAGFISHCGVGEGGVRSEILHILSYKSIVYSEIVSPIGIGRSE